MSDGHGETEAGALDRRIGETNIKALEKFAAVGDGLMSSPPFHNAFFNTFVNSPGFSKRLRRSERGIPV